MLVDAERYVLTTDKEPVIRDVLSPILEGAKSERDVTPVVGTWQDAAGR